MSSSDQRELERALGVPVTACPRAGEFHNLHYRADGIFIKVLDNPECHRHAVQAAPLAEELVPRTPRLLGHGDLGPDRWWLSYEWVDLAQFEPAPAAVETAGEMLGHLHRASAGMGLDDRLDRLDLRTEIDHRLSVLDRIDGAAADRVRKVRDRFDGVELTGQSVLLHGDVHWKNFGVDADGRIWWFDWEDAGYGHPLLDFGELADFPLSEPAVRDAFLRGYHRHAEPVYPWPEAMSLVRLHTAAGVLVYALARDLPKFAQQGYALLAALEASPGA
ncbi:phosphotransferase family protein [Amycolatopsis magusensis]|uniref:Aminoglycoside phosphotransferase domain-containing protein n=1 Tax=Amycolatopsis magusensis TaxID=882444 RepID=A0ABS4PUE6_9PSEU|nr:aminoglycoside phosphotransferase family protein [Amycolatopsis magusensis]MBP2183051.1 hypothetical protein [Amycolatopsis magusensis]